MDSERRANEAQSVLGNELYKEAFRTIEERLVGELAQAEIKPERAEYVRTLLVANRKVRMYLQQVVETGRLDALEAERKKNWLERVKLVK